MYRIVGRYGSGDAETVDYADTQEEADYMLAEYRLAFGTDWTLWIETD